MSVLIRKRGGSWEAAQEAPFAAEAELQEMLYDSPILIPVKGGEEIARVFVREAGLPGSGSTDLLGVDEKGNIYVVECKLASNQEIRRKVIGQVLEYGAFLWEMTFEDFNDLFRKREGKDLLDLIKEKAEKLEDEEEFRSKVAENLRCGSFTLMVAVDKINEELEKVIRYLAFSGSGVHLEAIELGLYGSKDTQVLVPKIHGRELQAPSTTPKKLSLEQVKANCPFPEQLDQLVEEWQTLGHSIVPGTKGLSLRAKIGEIFRPIFWALPTFVSVNFTVLRDYGLPSDAVETLKRTIAAIPGFNREKVFNQVEPRAYYENFDSNSARMIVRANNELVENLRSLVSAKH